MSNLCQTGYDDPVELGTDSVVQDGEYRCEHTSPFVVSGLN